MAATWRRRLGRLRRAFRTTPTPPAPPRERVAPVPAPRPSEEEVGERRLATFRQILGTLAPGRLLDLGAGHGAFSQIGQELGWDVTAVDARTERMPMTDGIRWLQADVRTVEVAGYECIAILGLLYHLELDDQLALLRRCAGTPTILDTHHTPKPWVTIDGWQGYIFPEAEVTPEELARIPTASWGNTQSFWATRPELIRMLHESGYRTVLALEPPLQPDRNFYLCL
jgi:hypothetical protein